jgi:signal transduction histidine kinase
MPCAPGLGKPPWVDSDRHPRDTSGGAQKGIGAPCHPALPAGTRPAPEVAAVFHLPTLFFLTSVTAAFLGLVLVALWIQDRKLRMLAIWGAAELLGGIGMGLVAARGHISDGLSIVVANTVVLTACGLAWNGARSFEGRRPRWLLGLVAAILWAAACQIPAFYGSLNNRVLFLYSAIATYFALATFEFWRGRAEYLPSRWMVLAVLSTHAALYGSRVPLTLLWPHDPAATMPLFQGWFVLLTAETLVHATAMAVLLVAMTKERAEAVAVRHLTSAREAADAVSAAKTRFIAQMSHELRTPLNALLGFAQLLRADPRLTPDQKQNAERLDAGGRHLLALVNESLDLAMIESGRLTLHPEATALRPVLTECLAMQGPATAAKFVELALEVDPALPDTATLDATRLRQILINLLVNATRFTPKHGRITLGAKALVGDRIALTVADTGPGVPPGRRDTLFTDAGPLDPLGPAGHRNAGLGLAICAGLARAMGGSIAFADNPDGRGSVFRVELPVS